MAFGGSPAGFTVRRTGDFTTASRRSIHVASLIVDAMEVPALSARRTARSAGTRAEGSGGRAATRKASPTRPSSRAVPMRPSQASRNAVTLESRASRNDADEGAPFVVEGDRRRAGDDGAHLA